MRVRGRRFFRGFEHAVPQPPATLVAASSSLYELRRGTQPGRRNYTPSVPRPLSTVRRRLEGRLLDLLLPSPIAARHVERSLLFSLDDDPARPSQRPLDLSLATIAAARHVSLDRRLSAGGD